MTTNNLSYTKMTLSALLVAAIYGALFLVLMTVLYKVEFGDSMFVPLHFYKWVPYVIATATMSICVFVIEMIRGIIRKKTSG